MLFVVACSGVEHEACQSSSGPIGRLSPANLVSQAILATAAASARDMGKVMGWLSPRTRGRADGKRVSELVVQALAAADVAGHDGLAH